MQVLRMEVMLMGEVQLASALLDVIPGSLAFCMLPSLSRSYEGMRICVSTLIYNLSSKLTATLKSVTQPEI